MKDTWLLGIRKVVVISLKMWQRGIRSRILEATDEYSASGVEVEISVCNFELQMRGRLLLSVTRNPVGLQAMSGSRCLLIDQALAKSVWAQRLT